MDITLLEEMLSSGKSYAACAKILGVSRQAVHQQAEARGLNKIWDKESPTSKQLKLAQFNLAPEYFALCSLRFSRKRQNCKAQGVPFDLEFADIYWPTHCPVLGIEIDYWGTEGTRIETSPSFDKIIPEKGYTKGNVHIISWRANRIKNDGNAMEHRRIAEYIDKHSKPIID